MLIRVGLIGINSLDSTQIQHSNPRNPISRPSTPSTSYSYPHFLVDDEESIPAFTILSSPQPFRILRNEKRIHQSTYHATAQERPAMAKDLRRSEYALELPRPSVDHPAFLQSSSTALYRIFSTIIINSSTDDRSFIRRDSPSRISSKMSLAFPRGRSGDGRWWWWERDCAGIIGVA